jgi:hypothetical protein
MQLSPEAKLSERSWGIQKVKANLLARTTSTNDEQHAAQCAAVLAANGKKDYGLYIPQNR